MSQGEHSHTSIPIDNLSGTTQSTSTIQLDEKGTNDGQSQKTTNEYAGYIVRKNISVKDGITRLVVGGSLEMEYEFSSNDEISTLSEEEITEDTFPDYKNVYFMMPGNDYLYVDLKQSSGKEESLLVAPNEVYYSERIGYCWVFLKWVFNGLDDGSSISKSYDKIEGNSFRLKSFKNALQCYAAVYNTGKDDGRSGDRWIEAQSKMTIDSMNRGISVEDWEKHGEMLKCLTSTFTGNTVKDREGYNELKGTLQLQYPEGLEKIQNISPETSLLLAHGNAVYRRVWKSSLIFYGVMALLMTISVAIGVNQDGTGWAKAESAVNLILTGAVAVVLSLSGLSSEGDFTIVNLVLWREKIDDITNKEEAERLIMGVASKVEDLGRYFDGPIMSWCSSKGGKTTIKTEISTEVFGRNAITLMSKSAFVKVGKKYMRVIDTRDRFWHLKLVDKTDTKALENEKVCKVVLEDVAHDLAWQLEKVG